MNIWVDIANPPQVLFMQPLIGEMQKRNHQITITTRHHSEAVDLADHYKLRHLVIGAHGGGTSIGKGMAIVTRTLKLVQYLSNKKIQLAISGSSYSQALAAKLLKIPFVTLTDYEGNPGLHIVCRVAQKILTPRFFSKQNLFRYGASENKIIHYNGLKENIYLNSFIPDPSFFKKAGIPSEKFIITMRPESNVSAYHEFENPLFDETLKYIVNQKNTFVILLPRNMKQREKYQALGLPNVMIPSHVLNGPNLVYHSDLVIGAGGTMNREAVVLGSFVYSLFMGLLGSVDKYLIDSGKMNWIRSRSEIPTIKIQKKQQSNYKRTDDTLVREITDVILGS
jgi:predicted glycosyltransferase